MFPISPELSSLLLEESIAIKVELQEEIFAVASRCDLNSVDELLTVCVDPAFFFLRISEAWILVAFIPDSAPVKARMVYASSVEPLRKQCGCSIVLHYSEKTSLKEIAQTVAEKKAPAPRAQHDAPEVAEGHQTTYVHGVVLPFESEAERAIISMAQGSNFAVVLRIENEIIGVEELVVEKEPVEAVAKRVGLEPRFILLRFPDDDVVFVYICPAGCKVKQRMVYSTTKASVIATASALGLAIAKKLEFGDVADLTTSSLMAELAPTTEVVAAKFAKPTKPGKGKARLIE